MFMKDIAKRKYKSNADSTIDVKTKSDLKRVKEVTGIIPPFADKWFVDVEIDKLELKELVGVIENSYTCSFFITVSNYRQYKTLKDMLTDRHISDVQDYYVNYLNRADIIYLYDAFVPEDKRLTKTLFDYVVQSYSGDIEALFDLFTQLGQGKKVSSRKDIADICGMGGLSIESFIFMLLKEPSKSEKGLKKVLKNRVQAGRELGQVYSWSTMYNFIHKSLRSMIEIKMLRTSGVIYKSIRNIPDGYDEKALARYQKYIWRLNEIPLSRLLRLIDSMGVTAWKTDSDYLNFVYTYFTRNYTDGVFNPKGGV